MWQELFTYLLLPPLDWIQVEVSSYCNALCSYCPRTVYRDDWQDRHLPLAEFQKLLPAFTKTNMVYLQGWGEPFLNPDFFEMVRLVKKAGCRVGVTTNGMLLNEDKIERLLAEQVDIIAFTLAGVEPARNDLIRKGTRQAAVFEVIRQLNRLKQERGATQPTIHIAYMLLRSGLEEVTRLPRLLEGLGIEQVVITLLDLVPNESLAPEAIRPATESEYQQLHALLEAVRREGEKANLDIHYQLTHPTRQRQSCGENIQQALFISSDGRVSPCTFTNLSLADGADRSYERLTFGNINQTPLVSIWRQETYTAFRQSFYNGQIPAICRGCAKLFVVE